MTTSLPVIEKVPDARHDVQLGARTYARGLACVHCGLCLPACPTYTETFNEADSPRGRIQLMLGLSDGRINLTPAVKEHLELCLNCRACETACPSGVVYHELIEETRHEFARHADGSFADRLQRWFLLNILTHPTRLKLALLPPRMMQKIGVYTLMQRLGLFGLLPLGLRKMAEMLPPRGRLWPKRLPATVPADRKTANAQVDFFSSCVGSVIAEHIDRQTTELLAACDITVRVPRSQVCCGAIHLHNGDRVSAMLLARQNIDVFLPENANDDSNDDSATANMIVTNVAGCGAMLREYDMLLRDDPEYAERARSFVARVRDISEALLELQLPPMRHAVNDTVTYHDACHLAHAQRVTSAPRLLLRMIPGLQLIPLPESDTCCGAAGTYNLQQPQMAARLAERKIENIASTGAATCATGNVGCAMQISLGASQRGQRLRVVHTVELLHAAIFGLPNGQK